MAWTLVSFRLEPRTLPAAARFHAVGDQPLDHQHTPRLQQGSRVPAVVLAVCARAAAHGMLDRTVHLNMFQVVWIHRRQRSTR